MAIQLDKDAARLLGAYQTVTDLTQEQEQKLLALGGDKPLCRAEIEGVLDQAAMQKAMALVKAPGCKDDAAFETTFIGRARVVKENARVQVTPRHIPVVRVDPWEAKLEIDPRASYVVIVSGSKFEPNVDRPRPRFMHLIARTSGEDGKPTDADYDRLARELKEASFGKLNWNPAGEALDLRAMDIKWIGSLRASVDTKDFDEPEFDHGSSAVAISITKNGGEISRTNTLDPENIQRTTTYHALPGTELPDRNRPIGGPQDVVVQDQTPPETRHSRISVSLEASKDMPRGTWMSEPESGKYLNIGLRVGARWLLEAATSGSVSLLGKTIEASVPKDDIYFNGSNPGNAKIELPPNRSIQWALQQSVQTRFGRVATDTRAENLSVSAQYFANTANVMLGGAAFRPLADVDFATIAGNGSIQAEKRPLPRDRERDGQRITLRLNDTFLTAGEDGSVKGWKIDVGYRETNAEGQTVWVPAKREGGEGLFKIGAGAGACGGKASEFTVDIENLKAAREAGRKLEVLVYDANNLPVGRVMVGLDQIEWAADAAR